jgi:hypothetical protein
MLAGTDVMGVASREETQLQLVKLARFSGSPPTRLPPPQVIVDAGVRMADILSAVKGEDRDMAVSAARCRLTAVPSGIMTSSPDNGVGLT